MNTPAPKTPTPLSSHRRRRGPRALAMSLVFLVVMSVYSLYANGYGVLTSSHQETAPDGKMVIRRCAYFTGRETVINHIMRPAGDKRGAPSCALVMKVYLDQTQPMQPQTRP